ncbi:MAG: hypothetical protein VB137_05415 [Burkholderia sp.]
MLKKVDAASAAEFKRWSVGRKRPVVLRLLRGESIGAVSREVGVTMRRCPIRS